MTDLSSISVREIVGSPNCVDTQDGQSVHEQIAASLDKGLPTTVNFSGVERVTTAFLNAAIGQLYNEFSEDKIRELLKFEDYSPVVASAIGKVVARAKEFFRNSDKLDQITKDVLEDK